MLIRASSVMSRSTSNARGMPDGGGGGGGERGWGSGVDIQVRSSADAIG